MPSWPSVLGLRQEEQGHSPSNAEIWRALGNVPLMTSAVWSANNLAVYTPVYIPRRAKFNSVGIFNGSAVSGNFDLGIYLPDAEGKPGARLWHSGSKAQSGTTQIQTTSTNIPAGGLDLSGLFYFAVAFDNTTAQVTRICTSTIGSNFCLGSIFTEAAAFLLPANATPNAGIVTAAVPYIAGFR